MGVFRDLTNKRYGNLVAISDSGERYKGQVIWRCLCDCGNTCYIKTTNLTSCWECNQKKSSTEFYDFVTWINNVYQSLSQKGIL